MVVGGGGGRWEAGGEEGWWGREWTEGTVREVEGGKEAHKNDLVGPCSLAVLVREMYNVRMLVLLR